MNPGRSTPPHFISYKLCYPHDQLRSLWQSQALKFGGIFLNLRLIPQEKMLAWYHRSGQELGVGEVKGSRNETTRIILLNWCSIKLISICVSVYPYLRAAVTPLQKSSFLQWQRLVQKLATDQSLEGSCRWSV